MKTSQLLLCLSCVLAISIGQLLFKRTGILLSNQGDWLNPKILLTVGLAGVIYFSATLLWIYLLKDIPLNKAYMLMALSFIFVPIASTYFFNETLSMEFYLGSSLIIAGLLVIFKTY